MFRQEAYFSHFMIKGILVIWWMRVF